jgi:sulfatase maturation enzyme AslB (radical SAM superfamily)
VTVGSTAEFKSKITLIEQIAGVGLVFRVVTKAYNEFKEQTNNFNFLFVMNQSKVRYILPETFNDILEFHEAQRRLFYEKII